jgi:hypothetical protein
MNAFLDLAERQIPAPVKARRRAAEKRAATREEKALAERDAQFRHWQREHRAELDAALAGPHGGALARLVLDAMTLESDRTLIEQVRPDDWRTADGDIRFLVLRLVGEAIMRLRERNGLPPFDDPLLDQPPSAFLKGDAAMIIREALDEFAAARSRVFAAREQTVGASDVGQCARAVYFAKNEHDPDFGAPRNPDAVDGWGARQRGTTVEEHFWTPALRAKYGARLLLAGPEQETFALSFLSATPDALLTACEDDELADLGVPSIGGDGSIILECKTIDPRTRLDGPRLAHVFQAQVQLGLVHALTRHRPEYALISYIDASFWDAVREYPTRRDPKIFETAQQRAAQILTAKSAHALPPEGWIAGGRECERCPFSRACGNIRATVPARIVEPSPEFVAEIVELARHAKRLEDEAELAFAAHRAAQQDIKDRLSANNVRRIDGDGVKLTWSAMKGRPSYDMKAIREAATAAGIDLTQFETTGAPSDRLDIRIADRRSEPAK